MRASKYHIIVFGATSFVGKILCSYLLEKFGVAGKEIKWAASARSKEKLELLRSELGAGAAKLPLIVADASNEASLQVLCAQTQVIISTVGPYALYGEPMIKACAESGTDYCDLTGEVQWISKMVTGYEKLAKKSGARIVHCCGFDSIPSDLGVFFLQQQAKQRYGEYCEQVKMRVKAISGTASGGTVASLVNVVKEASCNPDLRRELADPYSICPPMHGCTTRQLDLKTGQYDASFKSWITPFVMAAINTRVVHRSNALAGHAYGKNFRYDEALMTKSGVKGFVVAQGMACAMAGFMLALTRPTARHLIESYALPKPGEGPSPTAQEKGFYDLRFWGRTVNGQEIRCKVTGDRDPGYGSTAKMLGQAAACLVKDVAADFPGGFWTPATIFGEKLIARLESDAGLRFSVVEA